MRTFSPAATKFEATGVLLAVHEIFAGRSTAAKWCTFRLAALDMPLDTRRVRGREDGASRAFPCGFSRVQVYATAASTVTD
jgi:hypothetical protein